MHDPVNSPSHYAQGGIESIEAIQASMSSEAFKGFLKGNCQKYLWRYERKNGKEDLLKCQWYLNKLIETIETDEAYAQRIENTVSEFLTELKTPMDDAEPADPDAYMISGCPSFRQGPPEPFDDDDCWKRAYG
jgi:CHASE3 domain sensor protein